MPTLLPRKALRKSEVGCDGTRPTPTDFAVVIKGRIIEVSGDLLTIEYATTQGVNSFKAPKGILEGHDPERNAHIIFTPVDPAKKTTPDALAKAFEKFKIDADRGIAKKGSQGLVGLVVK
jgi:hypothetical protein